MRDTLAYMAGILARAALVGLYLAGVGGLTLGAQLILGA